MPTTKTFSPSPRHVERRWYVVDADGAVLGRLASEVAKILRGKHKPIFAPHVDTGDHVVVINARGVRLTGGKEQKKIYYRHSQYPGGLREVDYARLLTQRPALAVEKAIRGMLPKNRLGRQMVRKLSVYAGPEHPHQAQRPQPLGLGEVPRWEGLPAPKPKPAPAPKPEAAARPGKGRVGTVGPEAPSRPGTRAAKPAASRRTGASTGAAGRSTVKRSTAKRATAAGQGRSRGAAKRPEASGRRTRSSPPEAETKES